MTARFSLATGSSRNGGASKPPGCGIFLFGCAFLGMGLLFLVIMTRDAYLSLRTLLWTETPCRIEASGVSIRPDGDGPRHVFEVRYTYAVRGLDRTGTQVSVGYSGGTDASAAQRLSLRYPEGETRTCWVDPKDPGSAVLLRSSPWKALQPLFPLPFIAVGAGVLWFSAKARRLARREPATEPPISASARWQGLGGRALVPFFGLFLVVGLVAFWAIGVRPTLGVIRARQWVETPCVVVASAVRAHHGDDSTTYSADILYEYRAGGRTLRANRLDFLGGSSGGVEAKREIVNRYRPGTRTVCYVNPDDPSDAVLSRNFRPAFLVGLAPLAFVLAGGWGVVWSLRRARARSAILAPREGQAVLRPRQGPLAKFAGVVFAALFWNGIVSVFLYQVWQGWHRGRPDVFLTLFMVPFVLVGLGLVAGVGYSLLAALNPRLTLRLDGRGVSPGEDVGVDWRFSGSAGRIRDLRIWLEGREEVEPGGDGSAKRVHVFATVPAAVQPAPGSAIGSGRSTVRVPPEAVPSFDGGRHRIVWEIKVHGDIPHWPDVDEAYPLTVLPGKGG